MWFLTKPTCVYAHIQTMANIHVLIYTIFRFWFPLNNWVTAISTIKVMEGYSCGARVASYTYVEKQYNTYIDNILAVFSFLLKIHTL